MPAPGLLKEAWSYTFPDDGSGFRGVVDPAENLYWIEATGIDLFATSKTRDGYPRFRVAIYGGYPPGQIPHLIDRNRFIYGAAHKVASISTANGARHRSIGATLSRPAPWSRARRS